MNGGRDSLDIEGNGSAVTRVSTSSIARRGSETEKPNEIREVLAQIAKLVSKALVLALRLCGDMVGARYTGLLTKEGQQGQRSTDTSGDGDTAVEEKEEETSSEELVAAVDER